MTRNRATGVRTSAAIRVGKITASETLGFAAALVLTALGASTAAAQDWPTKAIRAIVPLSGQRHRHDRAHRTGPTLATTRPAHRRGKSSRCRQYDRHGHR